MNRYRSAMDKISVTPEMAARILKKASSETKQKSEIQKLLYPKWIRPASAIAACCAVIFAAVMIYPSIFNGNRVNQPIQTPQMSGEGTQSGGVQASGSPIEKSTGIDSLKKVISFQLYVPGKLPSGYQTEDTSVIAGKLAQIIYFDGSNTIVYREAKGMEDVSGDYTSYDVTEVVTIADAVITLKGNKSLVNLATWTKDSCSFSLSFSNGLDKTAVVEIIASMEKV